MKEGRIERERKKVSRPLSWCLFKAGRQTSFRTIARGSGHNVGTKTGLSSGYSRERWELRAKEEWGLRGWKLLRGHIGVSGQGFYQPDLAGFRLKAG